MNWFKSDPVQFVDLSDLHRKRLIREAEYRQDLDRQSKVLRVSGKVPVPVVSRLAKTERM